MSIQYYRTEKGRQELTERSVRLNARQRALLLMIESEEANTLLRNQIEKLATPENLAQLVEHGLIESVGGVPAGQDLLAQLAIPATASNEAEFVTASVQPASVEAVLVQPVPVQQPTVSPQAATPHTVAQQATSPQAATAVEPAPVPLAVVQPPVLTARVAVEQPAVVAGLAAIEVPEVALSFDEVKLMMVASLRRDCGLLAAPLVRDIEKAATAGQLRMCQMRWVTLLTESRAGAANIAMWKEQINDNLKHLA